MTFTESNLDMNILIVDDKPSNVDATKHFLKKIGFKNFFQESSCYDALERLKTEKIQFVFCRYNLPFFNGITFFEEVKADLNVRRVPIVIYEENLTPDDVSLFVEYGVDDYLSIPFVGKELAAVIEKSWARYVDVNNPEFVFDEARRSFMQGNLEAALQKFKELLPSPNLTQRCLVAIGRIAFRKDDMQGALEYAKKVCRDFPQYVHAQQFYGEVLLRLNQPLEALEAFFKAIEISPKNPYRYEVVGKILATLQLWEEAEKIYRSALNRKLEFASLYFGLASSLSNQFKTKEAIAIYKKITTENPNNVGFLRGLAKCFKSEGDFKNSAIYYERCMQLEPTNPKIYYDLAMLALAMDNQHNAIELLIKAIDLKPDFEKAKLKLNALRKGEEAGKATEQKNPQVSIDKHIQEKIYKLSCSFEESSRLKDCDQENKDDNKLTSTEMRLVFEQSDEIVFQHFEDACLKLRKGLASILKTWTSSITEISSEIAGAIGDLVFGMSTFSNEELQKVKTIFTERNFENISRENINEVLTERDKVFQDIVCTVMQELQFQDLMSQVLGALAFAERVSYECVALNKEIDIQGIIVKLPTEEMRASLRTFVHDAKGRVTPKYVYFSGVENFIKQQLSELYIQLSESCKRLVTSITLMQQSASMPGKVLQEININFENKQNELFKINFGEIESILHAYEKLNIDFSAMFGIIRFFLLLQGRIQVLFNIFRTVSELNPGKAKVPEIRMIMNSKGVDLRLIWEKCDQLCVSMTEKILLERALVDCQIKSS